MSIASRPILDLCGGSGAWSKPYRDAGYPVVVVDPQAAALPGNYRGTVQDFLAREVYSKVPWFYGVLAAPPCTEFAGSGARWWKEKAEKDPLLLAEALRVYDTCKEIIQLVKPAWWALENPVGRLRRLRPELGAPLLTFDPCDYGDPHTKKTQVWGEFNLPELKPVKAVGARPGQPNAWYSKLGGKSAATKRYRSQTPPGFAQAFFEANR